MSQPTQHAASTADRRHPLQEKHDFSVDRVRRLLEPGPVVLVSSGSGSETNIMTLGWQTVMQFQPSLIGCMISAGNHSFSLIRDSGECVINIPDAAMIDTVARIGNSSGAEIDKFEAFGLTPERSDQVEPPAIGECFASFECRLHDDVLVDSYNFFILEVVKAHVARDPDRFDMLHYRGDGEFQLSGRAVERKSLFTKVS